MDTFDVDSGIFAVLLSLAYGILLLPFVAAFSSGLRERNQILTTLACGLGGALLLARYQDILSELVVKPYGAMSPDVVTGILLVLTSIFWLLIASGLVPWMGRALGSLVRTGVGGAQPEYAQAGTGLRQSAFLTFGRVGIILLGACALYLWFVVPSILVGLERTFAQERMSASETREAHEQSIRDQTDTLALAVYLDYVAIQNQLADRARLLSCRESCQRRVRDLRSTVANTLAHYQIKQATPATFRVTLQDKALSASLQQSLRHLAKQGGLRLPSTGQAPISDPPQSATTEPVDHIALQEKTDERVASTITRAILSPGISRLAPALKDPVLLLAFIVELCVLIALLVSSARRPFVT